MSILFYNRPDYVTKSAGPLNTLDCQKYVEKAKCSKAMIPPNLSFDSIVDGKSRPPCSLQDFMDYLIYISHDAENLQFYLWLQSYTKRFEALPLTEKSLSPEWVIDGAAPDLRRPPTAKGPEKCLYTHTSFGNHSASYIIEVNIESPLATDRPSNMSSANTTKNDEADIRRAHYDVQPFRNEVQQILAHYVYIDSPRELNISHRTRSCILQALQHTTHPSAFSSVIPAISLTLRNQSHPNFIRWTICNGNKPRVLFIRSMSIVGLLLGIFMALVLCLSGSSRWWRVLVWPLWMFAVAGIVASSQGLCIVLSKAQTRQIHPWEIDDTNELMLDRTNTSSTAGIVQDCEGFGGCSHSMNHTSKRMRAFGDDNSYEHEPWIRNWAVQRWWRKVWCKRVWVQEEGLKIVQDRIVKQSHAWAAIVSIPAIVVLVVLPVGGFY